MTEAQKLAIWLELAKAAMMSPAHATRTIPMTAQELAAFGRTTADIMMQIVAGRLTQKGSP